jgi:hypothetical protein
MKLKVFAGAFQNHTRPGKLPRMITEEIRSQLIFLVSKFDRLE